MALSIFRWAIIEDDQTTIVCAECIDDAIHEGCSYPYQPNAVIRIGLAKWNDEEQRYE